MTKNKASIIRGKTFNLGRSYRNINEYQDLQLSRLTLPTQNRLIKPSFMEVSDELTDELNSVYIPELFAQLVGEKQQNIEVVKSGKRAFFNPKTYTLDISTLGFTKKPTLQEFVVEIKGGGMEQKHCDHVSREDVKRFIAKNNLKGFDNRDLSELLVFSKNEYMYFGTPEGAQDADIADNALDTFEYLSSLGVKVAPMLCRAKYPQIVQKSVEEFNKEKALTTVLAQEKRLMPSFVRAAYFENNPGRNQELLRLIDPSKDRLEKLTKTLFEDSVLHFEILGQTTEQREDGFHWDPIINMQSVYKTPEQIFKKNYGWYFVKDVVIAQTGIYFVDLEGVWIDKKARTLDKLRFQQDLYLTVLLKDIPRFLTHYNIALANTQDRRTMSLIESKVEAELVQRLNESEYLHIEPRNESFEVTVKYEKLGTTQTHNIPRRHLPKVIV